MKLPFVPGLQIKCYFAFCFKKHSQLANSMVGKRVRAQASEKTASDNKIFIFFFLKNLLLFLAQRESELNYLNNTSVYSIFRIR